MGRVHGAELGIPIGAFIGVNFIYLVSDLLLKLIIAVFIIYVGISSFSNKKSEFIEIKSSAPKNIVVGSIIGLLSIPLGIGGGKFLCSIFKNAWFRYKARYWNICCMRYYYINCFNNFIFIKRQS